VADLLDNLINDATLDEVLSLQKEKTDVIAAQDAELGMFELLIVARSTPVGDPSSAPSSPKEIFKLQAELKPFALSNTNTPPEMRNWIVRFRSYGSTSNIKLVGLADQRAVLCACLAPNLEVNLEGVLTTPASTLETCQLAVEAHFLLLNPIFTRRWDCFRIKKSGRPFQGLRRGPLPECCGGRHQEHVRGAAHGLHAADGVPDGDGAVRGAAEAG
jgi:hypothetical protein